MFLAYLLEPFLLRLLLELLFYLVNYTACVQQDKRSLIFLWYCRNVTNDSSRSAMLGNITDMSLKPIAKLCTWFAPPFNLVSVVENTTVLRGSNHHGYPQWLSRAHAKRCRKRCRGLKAYRSRYNSFLRRIFPRSTWIAATTTIRGSSTQATVDGLSVLLQFQDATGPCWTLKAKASNKIQSTAPPCDTIYSRRR